MSTQSNAGDRPEVMVHTHGGPDDSELQQDVGRILHEKGLECFYTEIHKHAEDDGLPAHHHHDYSCLIEAGAQRASEDFMPVRLELAEAQSALRTAEVFRHRDQKIMEALGPLVDLMAIFKEHAHKEVYDIDPGELTVRFAEVAISGIKAELGIDVQDEWLDVRIARQEVEMQNEKTAQDFTTDGGEY